MKKLLFLIVSMVVVGSVSAQVSRTIQSVTSEAIPAPAPSLEKELATSKAVLPSYFNSSIMGDMNVPVLNAKPQKSGNYTPFPNAILFTEYARNNGVEVDWNSSDFNVTYMLFPDSLPVSYVYYTNVDTGAKGFYLPAIGYCFDPYSKAYDPAVKKRLLQDDETGMVCGYRIDTLGVYGIYKIAEYDENSPDTLKIFLSYYNAYFHPDAKTVDPKRGIDYFRLFWNSGDLKGMGFVTPIIDYGNRRNIPEKGAVTKPAGTTTKTINYLLSPDDTIDDEHIRNIRISVADYLGEGFEVPVGSVTSIVIKYAPGYDYNKGDTIRRFDYNADTKEVISDDIRKNIYYAGAIADTNYAYFWDATGAFNSHYVENLNIRYDRPSYDRDSSSWNPDKYQLYSINYYAIPYGWIKFSYDDNEWPLDSLKNDAVTEPNPIVSKIYPNPAANQVRIELINDGTAELSIANMLGQTVTVATLNEMNNTVDISSLNSGVYVLKVSQSGNVYTTRFIKK